MSSVRLASTQLSPSNTKKSATTFPLPSLKALKGSTERELITIETLREHGENLQRFLNNPGQPQRITSPHEFANSLSTYREYVTSTMNLVNALNKIPLPTEGTRAEEIGRALIPLAVLALSTRERNTNSNYFYELYLRTHLDPMTNEPQISLTPISWIAGIHGHLELNLSSSKFPDCTAYLEKSEMLSMQYRDIGFRIARLQPKLQELEDIKAMAKAANNYQVGIDKLKAEIEVIRSEYPRLFERLIDVLPEDTERATAGVGIRFTYQRELLSSWIQFSNQLELVIEGALSTPEQRTPLVVRIPTIDSDGVVTLSATSWNINDQASLRDDKGMLSACIHLLVETRRLVKELLYSMDEFPETQASLAKISMEALQHPFSLDTSKFSGVLTTLFADDDPAVVAATLRFIAEPIVIKNASEEKYFQSFENLIDAQSIIWLVRKYLTASLESETTGAIVLLDEGTSTQGRGPAFLRKLKGLYQQHTYGEIARQVTGEITAIKANKEPYETLITLGALSVLIGNENTRARLKNQISNIRHLKELIPEVFEAESTVLTQSMEIVDKVIRNLTPTLADYFQSPGTEELMETIDNYKLLLAEPAILEGVSGNEGYKSGILLIGDPGVGKTSFVDALEADLGLKSFKIKPKGEDLAHPSQLLSAARSTIESLKKHAEQKQPAIFFIDEAESLMRSRKDPLSDSDQKALTCYLLEEIDEIRRKFPLVLLVAATNHIDEVDFGMQRQGRYDIPVFFGPPDALMRKNILIVTLAREKVAVELTDVQIEELTLLTDGFNPLPIKRTINEWNRFSPVRAKKKGGAFVPTFESLREAFTKECARTAKAKENFESLLRRNKMQHQSTTSPLPSAS